MVYGKLGGPVGVGKVGWRLRRIIKKQKKPAAETKKEFIS